MGRMSILDEIEETNRSLKSVTKAKLAINYLMVLPFLILTVIIMIGAIKSVGTEYESGKAETACAGESAVGPGGTAVGADTLSPRDKVRPDTVKTESGEAGPAKTEHKDSDSEDMHRMHRPPRAPRVTPMHHPALRHSFGH